jgi:hypothetical protein
VPGQLPQYGPLTVLQTSGTLNIPAGTGTTPYTVLLNFPINPGAGYRLIANTDTASLVRESFLGGFPYALGSVGSITNGYISGPSAAYYFFYN